jgi:hypothetical protein
VKCLSKPPVGTSDLHFQTRFPQKFGEQLKACLWKQCLSYWRSPSYNMVRILFTTISCIIFGALFWQKGDIKNMYVLKTVIVSIIKKILVENVYAYTYG